MRVKKMGVVYEPENRSVHVVREMAVNYSGDFTTSDSVVRVGYENEVEEKRRSTFYSKRLPRHHLRSHRRDVRRQKGLDRM